MVDLHQSNHRIRRQFTFRHELVDALDLAETENEVVRTAVRAARVAFPEKRFQLLVAGNDGVGTKLKVAARAGRFDTVGIDRVVLGSDWPFVGWDPSPTGWVQGLESLTQDEKDKVLWQNLESLLGI